MTLKKETEYTDQISSALGLNSGGVNAAITLLQDDATIPFIARYRKEQTGSLNEVELLDIRNLLTKLKELDARKSAILKSLENNGFLTDELGRQVKDAETLSSLEDIYLPYKPKRKTKASKAREKGLEPLALQLLEQRGNTPEELAADYINPELDIHNPEDALTGASHIIAEIVSEDAVVRSELRRLFSQKGVCRSILAKGKEDEAQKYRDYFDWAEPLSTVPSHRMLAIRRGEKEDLLDFSILPPSENAISILKNHFITGTAKDSLLVEEALKDSYKRLLSGSLETESRVTSKEKADREAIRIFSENLRQLLLAPPLGAKKTIGIDPGFRTGCKLACLDSQGKLLKYATIFPNMGSEKDNQARKTLLDLCSQYNIEAIAIGNGTACRETERFVRQISFTEKIEIVVVNESGASIYSASETAREEFPDIDLTVRGAVSIGRRLMDPLSELVKIEPKSIGVGQYQHDVDQTLLKQELDDVVMSCVNSVGVDVNTASARLLSYVSGIGDTLSKNIVKHRDANGPFLNRKALLKVPRLGPKAFEQSAGFLRITNGDTPLDQSAVHPESYHIVDKMAKDLGTPVDALINNEALCNKIDLKGYINDKIGIPTLKDIISELKKPGRDPRTAFQSFAFADGIEKISDLEPGMKLPGIITNITAFGAFVDVGVHQDGLVHISEMADRFVKDPATIVKVHQKVEVRVLDVDIQRKRIALSMKSETATTPKSPPPKKKAVGKKKPQRAGFNNPFADAFSKKK